MKDPIDELSALLKDANATVTFDPERNNTDPCFTCGLKPESAHKLVDMDLGGGRKVTRPFCTDCIEAKKPDYVHEREVDRKTILRLFNTLRKVANEREGLKNDRNFLRARLEKNQENTREFLDHGLRHLRAGVDRALQALKTGDHLDDNLIQNAMGITNYIARWNFIKDSMPYVSPMTFAEVPPPEPEPTAPPKKPTPRRRSR